MSGRAACELIGAGVTVRFGGRTAVDAVDLALAPGEIVALVGPNGAGKSTLLDCLAGLRTPDEGEVRLGAEPVLSLSDRTRARRIGHLAQSPQIAWALDVRTFVRLGRTAHRGLFGATAADAVAVDAALARTRLQSLAERDVTTLSGGERARALIARALAGEPEWLLADEPLTGLDPRHQLDAAELLQAFARDGGGVVVTLHDLAFAARVASRVVVLSHGRIVADAPPMEALAPAVIEAVYGVEARWHRGYATPLLEVRTLSSPLVGEEGARREALGR